VSQLGDLLRETREARGISLTTAERDTKIRAKYISALEDNNLTLLPGPVYARGFVRNYAHYLGLDPQEALDLFEQDSQPTRTKIRVARGEPAAPSRAPKDTEKISIHPLSPTPIDTRVRYGSSYIAVSLLAVPLIILFYFIYSVWGVNRSGNVPIPTPRPPTLTPIALNTQVVTAAGTGAFNTPTVAVAVPPNAPPTNTPVPNPATQPTQTLPPANQVTVSVNTTRDAWMRVIVDGVQKFSGTVPKGSNKQWVGKDKGRIRTGRGDSVQVTVNGATRGLMQIGNNLIVEKEWDRSGTEKVIQ